MEVQAVGKYIKVQPRKVRIVADEVRGKSAAYTVSLLRYHTSKGARELRKVLVSAMANALENHSLPPENLRIAKITVDEGPRQKRMRARAMGRGNRILKKTSHITVVVDDLQDNSVSKPHGTKAKPRPTFGASPKKGKGKSGGSHHGESEKASHAKAKGKQEEVVDMADVAATESKRLAMESEKDSAPDVKTEPKEEKKLASDEKSEETNDDQSDKNVNDQTKALPEESSDNEGVSN